MLILLRQAFTLMQRYILLYLQLCGYPVQLEEERRDTEMKSLNEDLMEIKDQLRRQLKWKEQAERLQTQINNKKEITSILAEKLADEKEDIESLRNLSIANIFSTIAGNKQEKLLAHEKEVIEAKLKYQEAYKVLSELKEEQQEYLLKIKELGDLNSIYSKMLDRKEKLIHDEQSIWSQALFDLTEAEVDVLGGLQEYEEAIEAGGIAQLALGDAKTSFEKAKGWSTFDMFGGGVISTSMKHSHLDTAKNTVHEAEKRLRQFQDELLDIQNHMKIDLNMSELLTFADYFFDGIVIDWMVHNKITQAMTQIEETFDLVTRTLKKLEEEQILLREKIDELSLERIKLIEQA